MSESFNYITQKKPSNSVENSENTKFQIPLSRVRELKNNSETSKFADLILALASFPSAVKYGFWARVCGCEISDLVELVKILNIPTIDKTQDGDGNIRVMPVELIDESGSIVKIKD